MTAIFTSRPATLLTVRVSFLALATVAVAETAFTQETPIGGRRVRTTNPVINAAFALGIERSPTFRERLAEIQATDGLVYVEDGTCGTNSVAACLVGRLVVAGPSRLLHIFIDLRKATGCRLVATIGHELQHTVEVLHDRSVRSGEAMYFLFARIGPVAFGPFETAAAQRTTLLIDREVCRD